MSIARVVLAAEESGMWSGVNHWVVGASVLLILLVALGALLAFGAGREHS
jgi:hypothetical protein